MPGGSIKCVGCFQLAQGNGREGGVKDMAKNSAKEQGTMSAASVFKAIDNVLKKPGMVTYFGMVTYLKSRQCI